MKFGRRLLGVCSFVVGVPLVIAGAILAVPYIGNAFSSEFPKGQELVAGIVFLAGAGACSAGVKLLGD